MTAVLMDRNQKRRSLKGGGGSTGAARGNGTDGPSPENAAIMLHVSHFSA